MFNPEYDAGPTAQAIAEGIKAAGLDPEHLTIVVACSDASQVHGGGVAGTAEVAVNITGDAVVAKVATR